MKWNFSSIEDTENNHSRDPEGDDIAARHQRARWIEPAQHVIVVWPPKSGVRPKR